MSGAARSGQSWAVIAGSEQGKGLWIKQRLRSLRPQRLIVWDRQGEYGPHASRAETLTQLAAELRRPRFKARYVPRGGSQQALHREFAAFCQLAYCAVGATVIVEELADVTNPSFAPPAWRRLNTAGRHHQGLLVIATSQSPAAIDKAFLGNATLLHVGFLGVHPHRKAVALELDVKPEEIRSLARGEYIELDRSSNRLSRGRVKVPGSGTGRPAASVPFGTGAGSAVPCPSSPNPSPSPLPSPSSRP